jgi:hypothetical protein
MNRRLTGFKLNLTYYHSYKCRWQNESEIILGYDKILLSPIIWTFLGLIVTVIITFA